MCLNLLASTGGKEQKGGRGMFVVMIRILASTSLVRDYLVIRHESGSPNTQAAMEGLVWTTQEFRRLSFDLGVQQPVFSASVAVSFRSTIFFFFSFSSFHPPFLLVQEAAR